MLRSRNRHSHHSLARSYRRVNTKRRPAIERALARGERTPGGCLRFTGATDPISGYGRIRVWKGDHWGVDYVHRVAYVAHYGPIPEGHEIDHVRDRGCEHHDCMDWRHLEAVTSQINKLRGRGPDVTRARHARARAEREGRA